MHVNSALCTSSQFSARQVSSPHQVAYLGQVRPVPGLRLLASVRAWPTPVSTCQHLDRAWATPGPRMGQQCQEILTGTIYVGEEEIYKYIKALYNYSNELKP